MKKILMGIVGAICVAFAVLLAAGVWLVWTLPDLCANEVLVVKPSPDEKFKAVVFQRDCGATTSFSTQVSVLSSGDTLKNEGGNVFSAHIDGGVVASGKGDGHGVAVSWIETNRLEVAYHLGARVFKKQSSYRGTDVKYRPLDDERR